MSCFEPDGTVESTFPCADVSLKKINFDLNNFPPITIPVDKDNKLNIVLQ